MNLDAQCDAETNGDWRARLAGNAIDLITHGIIPETKGGMANPAFQLDGFGFDSQKSSARLGKLTEMDQVSVVNQAIVS